GGGNFETADNGAGTVEFYSGTVNQNTDNLILSQTSTSTATFTMSGGLYDTTQATVNNAGHGDLNINDGLGVLNVSGGRMSVQDINLGRNSGDATLTLSGGILEVRAGLDFRSGGLTDVVNVQGGRLDLINGGTLHFRNGDDAVHLTAGVLDMGGGTIDFHGTSATFDFSGGTLLDVGTFGASLVQNGATSMLAPGASPGTTLVAGAYDLLAGIYQVEINGTAQGVDPGYDFVDVTGAAYLDGTVRVEFIAGYVSPMMSFDVLTATAITLGPNFLVDTGLAGVSGRYWTWDIIDGGNGQILQLNHVPEPVTLGLLGAGTLGLLVRRRRSRKGKRGKETAMKAMTFGMVLALLVGLVPCASAGLVAQWQLDDGTGSAIAVDSAGGNTGTLTNMTPASDWIAAPPPTVPSGTTFALDFDGSNDHVLIAGYKGITGAADRSMAAWIKTTDQSATVLSWGKNIGGEKWTFRTQNTNGPAGTIRVEVNGGYQVGTTFVTDDAWHHVATTFAGDNVNDVRLWVDGELEGIGAVGGQSINTGGATPGTGNDVRIGTSVAGDGKHFQGRMDEVRLYSHELDRNAIRALAGLAPDPYFAAVTADAPVAYYRLGEPSGSKAFNEGTPVSTPTAPSAIDGAYGGNVEYGQPSLVPSVTNPAARFDGTNDDRVTLPDHDDINTDGAGYSEKSFEAWFNTDAYAGGGAERVIYEQGGGTAGFNLYIQRDGGNYYLRHGAWTNNGAPAHFPTRVQVTPGEDYHAVAVYNDADNSYTLYLNGVPVSAKVNSNIASIASHSAGSIGYRTGDSRFHNGAVAGAGSRFDGVIDDVALYNSPLSIYSIQTHYEAATGDRLGIRERATLGVALNYDADEDTDGNTTWEDTIGTRTNGAVANNFNFNVTGVPRVAVTANFEIDNAYQFTGTGVGTDTLENVASRPDNNSATFEVLFRPSDLIGQEVIFETGGTGDGTSLWLDGSLLHFDVKNQANNARTTLDLAGIPLGFFHIIGVADLDANEARLYNFGFLAATSATVGTITDWAGADGFGLGGVNGAINFGSAGGFTGDISLFR
ncbi:LamG domain-containing protein, partial [bacterium]|nr:LamG domain-containing protein [bacterium]